MFNQRVNNLLEAADDAGVGGRQRELVEYAIRLLSRDYISLMDSAGNDPKVSTDSLKEVIDEEGKFRELKTY